MLYVLEQLLHAGKISKIRLSNSYVQFNAMDAFARLSFEIGYINTQSTSTISSPPPLICVMDPYGVAVPNLRITALEDLTLCT